MVNKWEISFSVFILKKFSLKVIFFHASSMSVSTLICL